MPPADSIAMLNAAPARGALVRGCEIVDQAPAQLLRGERLMLYALIIGLGPRQVLEIGSAEGGSSLIIAAALDELGCGRLVCVDPNHRISDALRGRISHRTTWIDRPTPDAFPDARRAAALPYDFAFIDGDHTYDGCRRDLEGALDLMGMSGRFLLHDGHHPDVRRAIRDFVASQPDRLTDCGPLTAEATMIDTGGPEPETWAGLHLVRFRRSRVSRNQVT